VTEIRSLKNIVILGGGATGWITALYAQRVMPESTITVIESEEIGILGAGEGSTPHLINFLDFVGIPVSHLVKHADATIKNGIKFTNWNNDGKDFYHGFYSLNNLDFNGCNIHERASSIDSAFVTNAARGDSVNDFSYTRKVSEKNKVPFLYKREFSSSANEDPIVKFDGLSYFSIHFNATKLAATLRDVALARGVSRIEGIVDNIKGNDLGDIVQLSIGKKHVLVDFIFDCSGFARFIIGKHYKAKWKSHADKLPVNAAVPFFIPIESKESIPAYTESIAMKYGWMWKIPTKERFGCGYVYDSSLISEKDVAEEIEKYLGYEPIYPRKNKGGFVFEAGYYETPWVKNCVAVGLASGFIEPLEATSIWVTIQSLEALFSNIDVLAFKDERNSEDFNRKFREMSDGVVDFVYFHYMSDRDDTDFWKKFTLENAPDYVKNLLESWEYRLPQYADFSKDKVWGMQSWLSVGAGIKRLNIPLLSKTFDVSFAQREASSSYAEMKNRQDIIADSCVDHRKFLEELAR
jgi:tryptophan halogenase